MSGSGGFEGAVGAARRDVTPDLSVRSRCWGPATHDLPTGVHRPLTLTALALREHGGGDPLALVTIDGTWHRRADDELRVRSHILDGVGLGPERLLVHLVHTHAGANLNTDEPDAPGGDHVASYLDYLAHQGLAAVTEALASMRSGVLEWTTGRCDLATCRDLVEDGRALVGFDPSVPADDTVVVGCARTRAGETIATVVNYACHPTTLAWQNRLLSPDYIGAAREVIESLTKAPCVFLQGASGDLAPAWQYVGDTSVADRHGRRLGYAVASALEGMTPVGTRLRRSGTVESGAPLAMWEPAPVEIPTLLRAARCDVELTPQELPGVAELAQRWAGIPDRSLTERLARARSLRSSYEPGSHLSYPVWVWMLGGTALVAHPGEAYSQLQRDLRSAHGATTVVMNLTNSPGFFYLPTTAAYNSGAYPSWQTLVAPGSLEAVRERAGALIETLETPMGV